MTDFHCSMCGKILEPEDDYVCIDDNAVICLSHVPPRPKKLVRIVDGVAEPFEMPPNVTKSRARPYQEQCWLAPLPPNNERLT